MTLKYSITQEEKSQDLAVHKWICKKRLQFFRFRVIDIITNPEGDANHDRRGYVQGNRGVYRSANQ